MSTSARARWPAGIGLVLVAFNLRPVFSSLSAVLPEVMATTGISALGASFLTVLPVLFLGLFAPVAPLASRRLGTERLVMVLLVALALGTALRGLAAYPALLLGTLVAGASIAAMNVVLPGLVKRDFPDRIALMTGIYSMAMCGGAAFAAGLTVPLMGALGGSWPAALAAWAVPVAVAAAFWTTRLRGSSAPARAPSVSGRLWRDPLAWQVTAFMGLQSAMAYCVFGWLAPLLRERGLDGVSAGLVVSLSVMVQVFASLVAPWAATRGRDQRPVAVLLAAMACLGLLGCLYGPLGTVWGWAALQGIGQGGLFSVAMTMVILRTPDAETAAALSGMAQGVGYVMAAAGPLLVGLIRAETGGFGAAGWIFAAIGLGAGAAALGAGRRRTVGER